MNTVPKIRIKTLCKEPVKADGEFILYWMIAYRRTGWSFSLQKAVEWARELNRPIVVLEALRCGYRWANDRLHNFILEWMSDNAKRFTHKGVLYYPYLETE